jgi:GT2 family glycosyltransferase/predicted SAM-dependent methyltransferase
MATKSIINKEPIDIIIPTYDNLEQLTACLASMYKTRNQFPMRFIVVNNGKRPLSGLFQLEDKNSLKMIDTGNNLGWTGGLAEGLKHSTSEYVMFANDDIYIPMCSFRWLSQMHRMLYIFPQVGAVGPSSNVVMGTQNIFSHTTGLSQSVPFLIGFCMLLRRKVLDEIGGVDPNMVTGDDIDISIRMAKAGYHMIADNSIFIYHHGFQTGERVYGTPDKPGGWNSKKQTEETKMALIKKHGFKEWWQVMTSQDNPRLKPWIRTHEIEIINKHLNGAEPEEIVDLGCGGEKVVKGSIGVDQIPPGEPIRDTNQISNADILADVSKRMPFDDGKFKVVIGRHVLEHCLDTIGTLEEWKRILDDNGQMIITVPDERISDTIILNPDHVHAYTPDTLKKVLSKVGMKVDEVEEFYSADSFTVFASKI